MGQNDKNNLWNNDLLQFARLLTELNSVDMVLSENAKKELMENMGLEWDDIDELFERAHNVFEDHKRDLFS